MVRVDKLIKSVESSKKGLFSRISSKRYSKGLYRGSKSRIKKIVYKAKQIQALDKTAIGYKTYKHKLEHTLHSPPREYQLVQPNQSTYFPKIQTKTHTPSKQYVAQLG